MSWAYCLRAPKNPAFERNARRFADELSEALTGTISHVHLQYQPIPWKDQPGALLEFAPSNNDPDLRYVRLENGTWINVVQRLTPNADNPKVVSTAKYSYSYSLGPDPDKDWLVRYDYEPEKEQDDEYPYPISHVHVNARNAIYDEFITKIKDKYTPLSHIHLPTKRISLEDFIDHLRVEFKVPLLHGKTDRDADEVLDKGRKRFEANRSDRRS